MFQCCGEGTRWAVEGVRVASAVKGVRRNVLLRQAAVHGSDHLLKLTLYAMYTTACSFVIAALNTLW